MLTFKAKGQTLFSVQPVPVAPTIPTPVPAPAPAVVEPAPQAPKRAKLVPVAKPVEVSVVGMTYEEALAAAFTPEEAAEPVFQALLQFYLKDKKDPAELHLVNARLQTTLRVTEFNPSKKIVKTIGGQYNVRGSSPIGVREARLYIPLWR